MIDTNALESTTRALPNEYCATSGCACAHTTLPREPRRGHVTFDDVTSYEKTPLGRILRNFRLRMRTSKGTPSGYLGSLPVAIVLVLLYYLYSSTIVSKNRGKPKKSAEKMYGEKSGRALNILLVM